MLPIYSQFPIPTYHVILFEASLEEPNNGFENPEALCRPGNKWQVFSIKLVKLPVDGGPVELYGYIAARDHVDSLLNYIVNISRDDPITVDQVQYCT